jgi:hypothetical protein
MTSIASAFSNEGVNLETVAGHGSDGGEEGWILVTFSSSEAEKEKMARKIRRLSKVRRMEELPYGSRRLCRFAVVRSLRELSPAEMGEEEVLVRRIREEGGEGWIYLLAGPREEVDPVLQRLKGAGLLASLVHTLLAPGSGPQI